MKQTKTKSVDARRLAETEMDDDDDVKSFILFYISLSFLLNLFLHTRAHKVNASPRVVSLFCVFAFGRVYVRDMRVSLSLCRVKRQIWITQNNNV